ncbi:MAG: hypothetical protein AAB896_00825 [Patescibacteria group bacterium]
MPNEARLILTRNVSSLGGEDEGILAMKAAVEADLASYTDEARLRAGMELGGLVADVTLSATRQELESAVAKLPDVDRDRLIRLRPFVNLVISIADSGAFNHTNDRKT